MTRCKQTTFAFQDLGEKKVEADFSGGYLSSDAGGLLLRELESKEQLLEGLAACFEDRRDPRYVEHPLPQLLKQRIIGLALGYEDLNDHEQLRCDPLLALLSEKEDLLGQKRRHREDEGKALAGAATLNRLELSHERQSRYHKIEADAQKIEDYLIGSAVKALPRRAREIVLDFDATDDPLHGQQQERFFHGYYRHYCYLPLYCFCGNIPFWAQLRPSNIDASKGTVEALAKIVRAIRQRFGRKVRIVVRADSAFAREAIMRWIEDQRELYYCFGLAKNPRLSKALGPALARAREKACLVGGTPVRFFTEFSYRTLNSWSRSRRVIGKAEVLPQGDNPRFIVTNLPAQGWPEDKEEERFGPEKLYEKFYCARGEMENRIKEQQLELFADRTSTHFMGSNQLRLWFSTFAYFLLQRLRSEVLYGTELAHATVSTLRRKLLKIAGSVKVSFRRVWVQWSSAYPYVALMRIAYSRLRDYPPPG